MKPVCKYNVCKLISTLLTVGTPVTTLCLCSDFFIHRSETAISAAGIFAILLTMLIAKDKIAENFKMPSAFVISTVCLILVLMLEYLIQPVKYVCIATMCTSGIDELTFKRFYKNIETCLPERYKISKYCGFIFTTSNKLIGGQDG
jgi:hypothetical protein